ncbi:dihydrodipicolinate synthase family protein [Govanella unica]|uniref:Dihydrodipicolinate synthase family protein n=1 Tax=Govanella unica TaxID=2975056 RepID=A0A9X3TY13_9PROT|nr:dihydrodipicolinate synthase family protein [Govania unica]MDA5193462.1 dihydrodipicolinate synthase family protein [Govania unica]
MDRSSVDWRGYIPATTTTFERDGTYNDAKFRQLLEWLHAQGMHGTVIAGTTGEWFALDRSERLAVYRAAGETLKGKMTIIAGCTGFSADDVVENAQMAADAKFDGILVTPPPYIAPNESELFSFYEDINNRISLPMCVYNWPPGTNIDMSLGLLTRLADLDKVVAIKNSTGNFRHFLDTFFALKDKVRIFGVPMNEMGASLVQHHNADGLMGAGGVLGSDQPNFFNSIWAGNIDEALAYGAKDRAIMTEWFNHDYTAKFGSAAAIFKEALNVQGVSGGYPRKPLLELTPENQEVICHSLRALGKTLVHDAA